MYTNLILVAGITILASALCSLLEAMILSTTTAEIENLKNRHLKRGLMLEKFKLDVEETSSAILSLNTIANTAGAVVSGSLAVRALGENNVTYFTFGLVVAILLFSEVIPKNAGVLYRPALQPFMVYPLGFIRIFMWPISQVLKFIVQLLLNKKLSVEGGDKDILLLAEKSAQEGILTVNERDMISNALSLDEIRIQEIMTPRTVVTAFEGSETIGEIFQKDGNIPFARLPVYSDNIDNIIGIVRRREILAKKAADQDQTRIEELMFETLFIPETASAADALQAFLKNHQQLAVVVDEYGSMAGVVTMEDIMESIIGQEIFEPDDPAIDMRELARQQQRKKRKNQARSTFTKSSSSS